MRSTSLSQDYSEIAERIFRCTGLLVELGISMSPLLKVRRCHKYGIAKVNFTKMCLVRLGCGITFGVSASGYAEGGMSLRDFSRSLASDRDISD